MNKKLIWVLLAGALAGTGCGQGNTDPKAEAPPPAQVEHEQDGSVVQVDHPEQIPLVTAVARSSRPELVLTGTVAPDISRNVPVVSLASGRIVELRSRLGDTVQKGQLLLIVRSSDVSGAYSDYHKAVADEELARTQFDRAKDLYAHGAISLNDLQIAHDAEEKAKVDVETSAEHLRLLGNDPDKPNSIVEIHAPISGVITDQQVTDGASLQAYGPNPFTISDLSFVWVVCDVHENQLASVRLGDTAEIRLNAYPDQLFKGTISNIGAILDPNLRTAKVRIEVRNPGIMRLGMFVTATFRGQKQVTHTTVPSTAILHLHDTRLGFRDHAGQKIPARGNRQRATRCPETCRKSFPASCPERKWSGTRSPFRTRWTSKMIRRLVDFALENRFMVLAAAVLLFGWGAISFHQLPVEAYPDVADNYVEIITQWPGISAEQIEQQVTIPLEIVMNGIPHVVHLRSFSLFGLSDLKLIFDDEEENAWNRERVLERLSQVTLPTGVVPQMGTDWSPVGQIYFFTLKSTNPQYDVMDLKSIEDWTVEKNFKSVPDVVDVASFGGPTREYQVRLDPTKLISYGLSIAQVEQQLTNNNTNAGGSFIESGQQQINIREVGLVRNVRDIENTVLTAKNGAALRVKDIAVVAQGPKIRLGQFARAIHREDGKIIDNDDVVSGIVLLRKGADADDALAGIHAKVKELNDRILPPGVKVVPFIDRSDLVHFTTHTVLHNLTEGIILVVIVLFLVCRECPRRNHRRSYHSFCAVVRRNVPQPEGHSRKLAFSWRAGFWNGRGWRGGHG